MHPLLVLPQVGGVGDPPDEMVSFASEERPMRPSRSAKFGGCPMSTILSMWAEDKGNEAAQTGNLVHDAVEKYHKEKEDRVNAGLAALETARLQFPGGDAKKAEKIFRAYASDPENVSAAVPWCEQQVTLRLAPAPEDRTGKPVVIQGTLDQVRENPDGSMTVWDVKTGSRLTGDETAEEYLIQQAVYLLAARQTLSESITRCGIIYTPAYESSRKRRHIPMALTVETAILLVAPLVHWVANVRSGVMQFRPSAESCKFCPVKPWPNCVNTARTAFGHNILLGV